jgi:hypothetical protein
MYVLSRYGGRGRGIWTNIDNGTIDVKDRRRRVKVKGKDGIAAEEKTWTGKKCTLLRYGQDLTVKEDKRVVYQEFYNPSTLRGMVKGGLWKRQKNFPLCGTNGTIECFSTSSGAYGKEVFIYNNGVTAYAAARWRKKLVVCRPDGKLWMVLKGKVHVSRYPIAEQLEKKETDFDIWRFMDGQDWDLTVYAADGITIVTQGKFKHRQKEGKWLEDSKIHYYMAGVRVSRGLYEESPSQWNPHELLRIPNTQLRCSLLGRFGYDKLLEKVKYRIIDTACDGGQLIEIAAKTGKNSSFGLDDTMRLIKVICPSTQQTYVLRVPPDIEKFEQARQWTFGLEAQSLRDGAHLELVTET